MSQIEDAIRPCMKDLGRSMPCRTYSDNMDIKGRSKFFYLGILVIVFVGLLGTSYHVAARDVNVVRPGV